nr:MAG TPA: hypothetical protein [Caudoviricetes sp.]
MLTAFIYIIKTSKLSSLYIRRNYTVKSSGIKPD